MAKRRSTKGRLFTRGKSRVWYCQYGTGGQAFVKRLLNPDGTRCRNRAEAEAARDNLLAPLLAGDRADQLRKLKNELTSAEDRAAELIEAAKPRIPIAEAWDHWPYVRNRRGRAERELSASTITDNRSLWGRFERWAAAGLADMESTTPEHAAAYRESLIAEGLSGHRVNLGVLVARVMFDAAGRNPNPFAGIRARGHVAKGRRELSTEELQSACMAAAGELRTLFALGLYCGFRMGDACSLTWGEIAPDLTMIRRIPGKTAYKGKEITLPMHSTLAAILAETPPALRRGPVVPGMAAMYVKDRAAVSKRIQEHFEACGIRTHAEKTTGEAGRAVVEVGFHSLRHSFVSLAAREGIPLHVVQDLVGHSSPAVQRIYLHTSNEDARRAIAALPIMTGGVFDAAERAARERLAELAASAPIGAVVEALAQLA